MYIVVLENMQVRTYDLEERSEWSLGRVTKEVTPDVPFTSKIVSRNHGTFIRKGGNWIYSDNGSKNGTWYNGSKMPGGVSQTRLNSGDILRIDSIDDIDNPDVRGVVVYVTDIDLGDEWITFDLQNGRNIITIGRERNNDICVDLPYISGHNTRLTREGEDFYVEDMDSMGGTWVNNKPLVKRQLLKEKDDITLCNVHFIYSYGYLIYNVVKNDNYEDDSNTEYDDIEYTHLAGDEVHAPKKKRAVSKTLVVADIAEKKVKVKGGYKTIIEDVHLEVNKGTLVALLGTTGAGKSTVMNCLNGMDSIGVSGTVTYNGQNLLDENVFKRLKPLIGSVPQGNVLHPSLKVNDELVRAAKYRLPDDMSNASIQERVDSVLKTLGITHIKNEPIHNCSGGEQKRVNVAIELVADRELLCLDEPDAGLDPNTKRELIETLKDLAANQNKTILTVIHDVSEINQFDQMIMMAKAGNVGRVVFSGSPAEAREHFGCDISKIYGLINKSDDAIKWADKWASRRS